MEQITGPFQGFYIASYACETGAPGAHYLGYSKICRRKPESYWDAQCLVKLCGDELHATPQEAVLDAERRARGQLGRLAPAATKMKPASA